jgi:hypothetical protein
MALTCPPAFNAVLQQASSTAVVPRLYVASYVVHVRVVVMCLYVLPISLPLFHGVYRYAFDPHISLRYGLRYSRQEHYL